MSKLSSQDLSELLADDSSISFYSDLYKEVYGYRPRHFQFTQREIDKEIDSLMEMNEVQFELQEMEHKIAKKDFLSRLDKIIKAGAGNAPTALRWLMEGEGVYDSEEFEYRNSLPQGYLKEIA